MKVYSWNVFCWNKKPEEMRRFISTLDFDVLCLQEVPDDLLGFLKTLSYEMAYTVDVIRLLSPKRRVTNYAVILTKHEIIDQGTFEYPDLDYPFHTRAFIKAMGALKWSWITDRGGVYADIQVGTQVVRVFSVHLSVWGPHYRAREFGIVMEHGTITRPLIICGDFNIFDSPHIKPFNLFLGAPMHMSTPWYPERALFEERFARYGLVNPLKGRVTHPVSRSQLDHIIVSDTLGVTGKGVSEASYGSDHKPIWLEIAF